MRQVRDQETRIGLGRAAGIAEHFGFHDDASLATQLRAAYRVSPYSVTVSSRGSKRDSVGCDPSVAPESGSRSSNSLYIGSSPTRGIVAVGVATGEPKHPLPDQVPERVQHLAGLAPVPDRRGQAPGQAKPIVDPLQQQGSAVRAGVRLVEPGDDRLEIPWTCSVVCVTQAVAIEPPRARASKRFGTASIAPLRGSVALPSHPSRVIRARPVRRSAAGSFPIGLPLGSRARIGFDCFPECCAHVLSWMA
jgi:hypothetical protein